MKILLKIVVKRQSSQAKDQVGVDASDRRRVVDVAVVARDGGRGSGVLEPTDRLLLVDPGIRSLVGIAPPAAGSAGNAMVAT